MVRSITLELTTSGLCALGLNVSVPLFPSSVKQQNVLIRGMEMWVERLPGEFGALVPGMS